MGRLAMVMLRYVHEGRLPSDDTAWLIRNLVSARRTIEEYEDALGQRGHVIEFTDIGWGIEHTIDCRAAGILNCPVHLRMSLENEIPGSFDHLDDGRYWVELTQNGKLAFTPLGDDDEVCDLTD